MTKKPKPPKPIKITDEIIKQEVEAVNKRIQTFKLAMEDLLNQMTRCSTVYVSKIRQLEQEIKELKNKK